MCKNKHFISPFAAAAFYGQHFDGRQNTQTLAHQDGTTGTYSFLRRVDDAASSFSGVVFMNEDTGHAVILFKGTDLPPRQEGAGRLGVVADLKTIFQARAGHDNQQRAAAEQLYLETYKNPAITTLEIIGYSIGSLHANYLAAKYGAYVTNIADMGLHDHVLKDIFKDAAEPPAAQLKTVTTLRLKADILPHIFRASAPRGRVIELDTGKPLWQRALALAHIPQAYAMMSKNRG